MKHKKALEHFCYFDINFNQNENKMSSTEQSPRKSRLEKKKEHKVK